MALESPFIDASLYQARRDAVTESKASPTAPMLLVPLHRITRVKVSGKDTLSFLQSKLTIDVKKWPESGGSYGYSVDINGRVLFDAHAVYEGGNDAVFWTEPGLGEAIFAALDKYIIMEDVTLTPSEEEQAWMLVGDDTAALDQILGVTFERAVDRVAQGNLEVVGLERAARPARLLVGNTSACVEQLIAQGVPTLTWDDWRAWEIGEGFVRVGHDLAIGETIPLEAGLDLGVHYNKGCYLGQEVIERLRSRGTPNREFRRVKLSGDAPASLPIAIVSDEGRDLGSLTSLNAAGQGIAVLRRRVLQSEEPVELFAGTPAGPSLAIISPVR